MNDLDKAIKENIIAREKLVDRLIENNHKQMELLEKEVILTAKLLKVYKQQHGR